VGLVLPATGREVAVTTDFDGEGTIECIPEEFNQVLTNLIQNAIEAVAEGTGKVDVRGGSRTATFCCMSSTTARASRGHAGQDLHALFHDQRPRPRMGMGLTITWRSCRVWGAPSRCAASRERAPSLPCACRRRGAVASPSPSLTYISPHVVRQATSS